MNWNDLKRKLSSRKFWAAVAGLVSAVLVVMNYGENEITQVVSVVSAAGVLIAYIFAEGSVDAAREKGDTQQSSEEL